MEFKKQGWVFSQTPIWAACDPNLNDGAHRLLAYLVWRQGTDAGSWPSIKKMATDLHVCRATIKRRLSNLDDCGYIEITKRSGRSSIYSAVADPKNASEKYTPRKKSTPLAELIPHADLTLPLSQKCTDTPCRIEPHDDTHERESGNDNFGEDAKIVTLQDSSERDTPTPTPTASPPPTAIDDDPDGKKEFEATFGAQPDCEPTTSDGDWTARQQKAEQDEPWLGWSDGRLHPRSGIGVDKLECVGWLIERETGRKPVDGQWKGWGKACAAIYQAGEGDFPAILEGIRRGWARDEQYRPRHPNGYVNEVANVKAAQKTAETAKPKRYSEAWYKEQMRNDPQRELNELAYERSRQ